MPRYKMHTLKNIHLVYYFLNDKTHTVTKQHFAGKINVFAIFKNIVKRMLFNICTQ